MSTPVVKFNQNALVQEFQRASGSDRRHVEDDRRSFVRSSNRSETSKVTQETSKKILMRKSFPETVIPTPDSQKHSVKSSRESRKSILENANANSTPMPGRRSRHRQSSQISTVDNGTSFVTDGHSNQRSNTFCNKSEYVTNPKQESIHSRLSNSLLNTHTNLNGMNETFGKPASNTK
jgi:hypothetical protein